MSMLRICARQGMLGADTMQGIWRQNACLWQVRRRAMAHPPPDGFLASPPRTCTAAPKDFNDRAGSIYAGTNEIQRNTMAKAVLVL